MCHHCTSSCTTTSLGCEARLYKEILKSDAETSLMQLVNTVAADLNLLQECHLLTHIRVKERWKGSTGTSLTNFAQQGHHGVVTSKSSLTRILQSHFLGHFNTASSFSTATSFTLQGRQHTSRTTATTIAPTSSVWKKGFSETSATPHH